MDFEAATWSKLREAVQAVHGKRPVSVSLEELYRVRMPCLALQCTPPPGCFQACSCRMQDMPGHIHAALCQLPQCMQDLTCLWPALSTRSNELMGALHAQLVEDMCLHKMADRLYASLQKECDSHIGAQLSRLAAEQTMDPVLFLSKARCSPELSHIGSKPGPEYVLGAIYAGPVPRPAIGAADGAADSRGWLLSCFPDGTCRQVAGALP